jgi:DNA mismatch repair ATPase MutS
MSIDELKETRKKILKAQRTADEATLDQLFELEDKVNKTIEDAPRRFQATQLERFNEAVANTSDLSDKELQVVFGHAKNIFQRTPSFQSSADGQAEAWQLAVEHYKEMNKLTVGKSKVNELERKVNDLKKKTSLDTAVQKGNSKQSDETRLFNMTSKPSSKLVSIPTLLSQTSTGVHRRFKWHHYK